MDPKNTSDQMKNEVLRVFKKSIDDDIAIPVAAMNSLINIIKHSNAATLMQLGNELAEAVGILKACKEEDLGGKTNISLVSGCDLFMKHVTKAFELQSKDFSYCKAELLKRGERFATMSLSSRLRIAKLGHNFIEDGFTVLLHGDSRCVTSLILRASERSTDLHSCTNTPTSNHHTNNSSFNVSNECEKQFNLVITEGRPESRGYETAKKFIAAGIPTRVIPDAAVATLLDEIDMCLVGAEGVMENGGIVNKVGTYQIAILAKAFNKPFYVAVESYKFARMYPLSQRDLRDWCHHSNSSSNSGSSGANNNEADVDDKEKDLSTVAATTTRTESQSSSSSSSSPSISSSPTIDFTPSEYITLLFTDLGVLTPAAVSDELIRLYQ